MVHVDQQDSNFYLHRLVILGVASQAGSVGPHPVLRYRGHRGLFHPSSGHSEQRGANTLHVCPIDTEHDLGHLGFEWLGVRGVSLRHGGQESFHDSDSPPFANEFSPVVFQFSVLKALRGSKNMLLD